MLHFPSKLQKQGPNGIPGRSDGLNLNATQQKSASHPIFLKVEEELHDARRVHTDGQEDDLRYALNMVINRVTELSSLLGEAYKTQADLEVQLNVAKSNLKMVIANNEMLEDALKRDTTVSSREVGWRRSSVRDGEPKGLRGSLERSQSVDFPSTPHDTSPPPSAGGSTASSSNAPPQDNRFFKFRFSTSSIVPGTQPPSRPGTPGGSGAGVQAHHLTSPSMPSLSSVRSKELEDLTAELEKERTARKQITEEKALLEAELESLSQALFEEANNMVATERKMRAESEEELKELRQEKEALRSALRVIEGENTHLRESALSSPHLNDTTPHAIAVSDPADSRPASRSSSRIGIKSRPQSLDLASTLPLPPSPAPSHQSYDDEPLADVDAEKTPSKLLPDDLLSPTVVSPEEESQPTPRFRTMPPPPEADDPFMGPSPWADVPSKSAPPEPSNSSHSMLVAASFSGIR